MKWLGQLPRLPEEILAQQAFEIFQESSKKPRGAQKKTENVKKDLDKIGINFESAKSRCSGSAGVLE